MPTMNHVVLLALIVFIVAVASGLAFASVRGFAAWRAFRGFQRVSEPALTDTATKIAGIEVRTAAATVQVERLERARAQLTESLATLSVISQAAEEAWKVVQRVRSVMPHK
jgi:predicted RNase H-like nuclease